MTYSNVYISYIIPGEKINDAGNQKLHLPLFSFDFGMFFFAILDRFLPLFTGNLDALFSRYVHMKEYVRDQLRILVVDLL